MSNTHRVSMNVFHEHSNLTGRGNVFISETLDKAIRSKGCTPRTNLSMFLTLNNLTSTKPLWKFVAVGGSTWQQDHVLYEFRIYEEDELLGSVGVEYKGRDYKIKVTNERIAKQRERGDSYHTTDPKKAEICIRKNFYRKHNAERMEKAAEMAARVINSERYDKERSQSDARSDLMRDAETFVLTHIAEYIKEFPKRGAAYEVYMHKREQYRTVKSIVDDFNKHQTTLVVLDGTLYITKTGDEILVLTDGELPYDMRLKLGTLKLVEDHQMVSGIGCKVDAKTFILLPPEAEAVTE